MNRRRAFTLLEVMIAVAILGLVGMSIFRFVSGTVAAVETARVDAQEEEFMEGFGAFLSYQMEHLPIRVGAITGEPHRFDNVSGDELRWIATPGPGMLTRFAGGEYTVALTTRQIPQGGGFEIGLNRQDIDAREEAVWYPLFGGVHGFEVRYFDGNQQEWVERWADLAVRPTIVLVRLWRDPEGDPYEWMLPVPYVSNDALSPEYNFNRRRGRGGRGGGGRGGPPREGQGGPGGRGGGERRGGEGRGERPMPGERPSGGLQNPGGNRPAGGTPGGRP